jgi:hypothetical protein
MNNNILLGIVCLLVVLTTFALATDVGVRTNQIQYDEEYSIFVYCIPTQPIKGYEFQISFNPEFLQVVEVIEGDIFQNYSTFFSNGIIDNDNGTVQNIYGVLLGDYFVNDTGTLIELIVMNNSTFGTGDISLNSVGVVNGTSYVNTTVVISFEYDINMDQKINLLDLLYVSNCYSYTGENGWIREDVDNNGIVDLLDLIFVSNHYGEIN